LQVIIKNVGLHTWCTPCKKRDNKNPNPFYQLLFFVHKARFSSFLLRKKCNKTCLCLKNRESSSIFCFLVRRIHLKGGTKKIQKRRKRSQKNPKKKKEHARNVLVFCWFFYLFHSQSTVQLELLMRCHTKRSLPFLDCNKSECRIYVQLRTYTAVFAAHARSVCNTNRAFFFVQKEGTSAKEGGKKPSRKGGGETNRH
jgi:hypothetical protein